jgi:hypothetical protein
MSAATEAEEDVALELGVEVEEQAVKKRTARALRKQATNDEGESLIAVLL